MSACPNSVSEQAWRDSGLAVWEIERFAEVARQVKNTFTHEWARAHRVTRTFTALGFNKGRLPNDL